MGSAMPSPRRSHSYQGQDMCVVELLGGLRGGFFLDSGASDGMTGSNTFLLERAFGWKGICVEPNSVFFERLQANRNAQCFNCCLSPEEGEVAFLEAAGVYGGMIDRYDPSFLEGLRNYLPALGSKDAPLPLTQKPARTISSVLSEAGAPPVIDYWSLDVEGAELALLQAFPFDRYRLRVLTVEHNHTPARGRIREFLEARGFALARELGIDDVFVNAPAGRHSWRGHWRRRRS
jgi:FkbM family methyltransferase